MLGKENHGEQGYHEPRAPEGGDAKVCFSLLCPQECHHRSCKGHKQSDTHPRLGECSLLDQKQRGAECVPDIGADAAQKHGEGKLWRISLQHNGSDNRIREVGNDAES